MQVKHLHQNQVAERWCMSPRTLERWRWMGIGPKFLKLGNRVTYRLEDIEQYEATSLRSSTAKNSSLYHRFSYAIAIFPLLSALTH